ncbi:MAG: hypothetical protein HQL46_08195 [Gammaproteobacteria bacterium]|nr:hypothetical protein [Gammaproteobacteria bacterium]
MMDYIRRYIEATTFLTDERCDINELLNTTDDEACSIAKAIVDIGVPTVIIFLGGKEFVRKSRNFSPMELMREIQRPWEIMHS